VQEITVLVMIGAPQIRHTYDLSYLDAAIIAASRALGCREVLSDMRT
jgi:predicted nucleic acid-binding protein